MVHWIRGLKKVFSVFFALLGKMSFRIRRKDLQICDIKRKIELHLLCERNFSTTPSLQFHFSKFVTSSSRAASNFCPKKWTNMHKSKSENNFLEQRGGDMRLFPLLRRVRNLSFQCRGSSTADFLNYLKAVSKFSCAIEREKQGRSTNRWRRI